MMRYEKVADLRRDEAILAHSLVERHYERDPRFKKYGEAGYNRSVEDALFNLQYALAAFESQSEVLFVKYLQWTQTLFDGLKLPSDTLKTYYDLVIEMIEELVESEIFSKALADELNAFLRKGLETFDRETEAKRTALANPFAELLESYKKALLEGDRQKATFLIRDAVDHGVDLRDLYRHVFAPFQVALGELWHQKKISVGQEHLATAATQFIMSLLYDEMLRIPKKNKILLGACVSGELHEVGMRMVCDFMEASGWHTYYLGANTPEGGLVSFIEEKRPSALALSCTMAFHIPKLTSMVEKVRAAYPTLPIVVGGYPFNIDPTLYERVGADASARGFDEVYEVLEKCTEEAI